MIGSYGSHRGRLPRNEHDGLRVERWEFGRLPQQGAVRRMKSADGVGERE